MAAAFSPHLQTTDRWGSRSDKITVVVTGPSSYATGGFTGLLKASGFAIIHSIIFEPNTLLSAPYGVVYLRSTDKLILVDNAGVEVANATDMSEFSFRLTIIGS